MESKFKLQTLIRPNIAAMQPYSSARDEFKEFDKEMVFLDANENPFGKGLNRYPDPNQSSLKKSFSKVRGVPSAQILLGNGSDEVLDLIFRAFCEPNVDTIITLPPTYGMYKVLANLNAIENREVLLRKDFQIDTQEVLNAQTANTKLLFVCSPNNPTGTVFNEEDIKELLCNFNGLVVIDEAYIDFSASESWVSKLSMYPNLIVTQTLSKAFGMAGIRLGVCYASVEIISVLNKIKPPYNVNALTQQRALEQLGKHSEIDSQIRFLKEQRGVLSKALLQLKCIEEIVPSEANFLLVKVDDATKRYQQLIEKGIVVRNRSNQPLCENTLRFTIGTETENKILIETLKTL
ncbi:histidinol-phosphate transaminase [Marinirhabdus gelatinilytica]|uniref:Histidinol-phosphate aminotransferase n=1 Tax=Marinirhabdus gelatinilytica TaxID=1703343 RepID=A0A370QA72_9FLAO|nr:histidinol-phosphate transaminase [Marinirhabdus gelatinilytica]RDK85275.1 histidinol-phosphate aminotransferase [Marinirhabdus gelatinilytica]